MAKLLLTLFLISVSFRLLVDFSIVAKSDLYSQLVEDSQESQKEELEKGQKEIKLTFHFLRFTSAHLILKKQLKASLHHAEPLAGYVSSSFTPPEPTLLA